MNSPLQTSVQSPIEDRDPPPLPRYQQILLAVDSSDHANRGLLDSIALARLWNADITGTHVYAAKLHDVRFRQMEGGLPEQFREEEELERQRDVHDDLITRGLTIITDSYLDHSERECREAELAFRRRALEGKNYRELAREANSGRYDLLVMGALGLGAIQGSRVGTVCQRVVRRSDIDTLIIKEPDRPLAEGPIVVAIDGSTRAYGGLLTAMALSRHWQVPLKVIAAFDPYFHYVAFNRIAGVLSEEAGKVFRFQEQEKLHEEIIDSGLAKIYQGHLDVAEKIARDQGFEPGVDFETRLLDGKPHDAIEKYLQEVDPSLLVVGKLGIHADAELDIGGTTENLLNNTRCALLISQREFQPRVDIIAESTTSWTTQAEQRMQRVPEFVQGMARMAILRYAQEHGHTVITARIVEEATAQLCPGHAKQAMADIVAAHDAGELATKPIEELVMRWSDEAKALLLSVDDLSLRGNLSMRAEKKARAAGAESVLPEHVAPFLDSPVKPQTPSSPQPHAEALHWNAAALARLMRVPEGFMRDASRQRIEAYAREIRSGEVTLEIAEAGLQRAREAMTAQMQDKATTSPAGDEKAATATCPFGHAAKEQEADAPLAWSEAALQRLQQVPDGFMRDLTRQRIEAFARRQGAQEITPALMDEKYQEWDAGSQKQQRRLDWSEEALQRIQRIPDFVRGMVVKEVERCALEQGLDSVTTETLGKAMSRWEGVGAFHSETHPGLYGDKS